MADGVKCFKCGQTGHWSRDCTKPPSEWLSRPKAPAAGPAAASAAPPSFDRAGTPGPSSTQRAAAQTPAAGGTQPRAKGCYKCGKTGHWARDCTAPASEQVPRTFDAAENQPPPNTGLPKSEAPKKAAPKRKRKIKIRFAELKERDALSDVFCNFPERFAKQFRGKGHEVSDLRRLLEMYKIWQQKHFPLHGFDEALDQIADIGKTNQLKMEMREMRQGALKVIQRSKREAEQQQQEEDVAGEAQGSPAAAEEPAAAPADDGADWDENDELLAMQQEAWEQEAEAVPMDMLEGGPSAAQGAPASRPADSGEAGPSEALHTLPEEATASQLAEDEELLALAMEDADELLRQQPGASKEASGAAVQQQPSLSQLAEDEELLALAMEGEHEPLRQRPDVLEEGSKAPVEQRSSLSQLAEDEELLALAMEDEAPEALRHQPLASAPSHRSAQQQPSMSQLAEDAELLALAMEDDEPQQKHTAPAGPSHVSEHPQPPSASPLAEDGQLLALAMEDEAPKEPCHSQLPTQQKLVEASMPANKKQLRRVSRLSQLSTTQDEQASKDVEDADKQEVLPPSDMDNKVEHTALQPYSGLPQEHQQHLAATAAAEDGELLMLCEMDKQHAQPPQASEQAATAVMDHQDSEEEDAEPLVFTRKRQAVLAE